MEDHVTPPEGFKPKNYTQVISIIVGSGLCILGLAGLLFPAFAGLHQGWPDALITFTAGSTLLYTGGFTNNKRGAFLSCLLFGSFFGGVGILGLILGEPGTPTIGFIRPDPLLFKIIPGIIEHGKADHILNAFIGVILFGGALDWQRHLNSGKPKNINTPARKSQNRRSHYKWASDHR